jgi:hypothetical protein
MFFPPLPFLGLSCRVRMVFGQSHQGKFQFSCFFSFQFSVFLLFHADVSSVIGFFLLFLNWIFFSKAALMLMRVWALLFLYVKKKLQVWVDKLIQGLFGTKIWCFCI